MERVLGERRASMLDSMLEGAFFIDKPADWPRSRYVRKIADAQARRFGSTDGLANDYWIIADHLEEQND